MTMRLPTKGAAVASWLHHCDLEATGINRSTKVVLGGDVASLVKAIERAQLWLNGWPDIDQDENGTKYEVVGRSLEVAKDRVIARVDFLEVEKANPPSRPASNEQRRQGQSAESPLLPTNYPED